MQEEVTQKTIAISIQTAKLSAAVLQKAIKKLLAAGKNKLAEPHTGKQTLRQLRKHHAALSNVEITEQNIKAFSSVAKKYHMDFALKKDATTQPPHFIVFFKGNDKDFSFAKAFCPYDFGGLRGCEARVWSFFRKYDPSMDKYADFVKGDPTKEPMPLYIKPNRKLSVQDVQNGMRDHFEGTALDMTKDAGAGPYKVPYRWRPMHFKVDGQTYLNERAIATQQSGFVIVPQMRNWLPDAVGGILWFAADDADMAVFNPVYSSSLTVPECFRVGNGDLYNFSWTSAFWIHNWVANMAYGKYSFMIQDIRKVQQELENGYQSKIAVIDKAATELYNKDPEEARKFLTWFSTTTADGATARWKQLGEYLVVKYIDGNVKKEENGQFKRNQYGMPASPDFPGYDEDYYRSIVNSAGDRLKVIDN